MKNPYDVLGVPATATDEQIKDAYRKIARECQENMTPENERRMQAIDKAYDAVISMRRNHAGAYAASGSSLADVRTKLAANRVDDADTILEGVPQSGRNAEWYFLKGTVMYKRGWLEEATRHYQNACSMDPGNAEYRAAYNQVTAGRTGGYRRAAPAGGAGCGPCDICTTLICADCCCDCMGGDLIPCC